MATRAVIKVEGQPHVKLYKHWDGYPEATLPWLIEFNKEFGDIRGHQDTSYKFAQLIRSSVFLGEKHKLDLSQTTGWGIVEMEADCGEEYIYNLTLNGKIEVIQPY